MSKSREEGARAARGAHAATPVGASLGKGLTNGSGVVPTRGFTNGSGRTNGGGLTNGSGRTNGGRFAARDALRQLRRTRAARRRRVQAAVAGLVLALTALTAMVLATEVSSGPRVDGRFAEWDGRSFAVQNGERAGVVFAGLQSGPYAPEMYLELSHAAFANREDLWVFFDLDNQGDTGYWTGSMGAEAAVRISGEGGKLASATAFTFQGGDRFDLGSLASRGRTPSAAEGPRLEFQVPDGVRAFEVAAATPTGASTTGAVTLGGEAVVFNLRGAPLSLEVQNGIRIDGQFSDWTGVLRVSDPLDGALPARLDLTGLAAIGDATSAQFLVDVRGAAMRGTLPLRADGLGHDGPASATPSPPPARTSGTDRLEIYLDTDRDASSGAPYAGIGADRLLRIGGVDGVVVAADFFEFTDGAWLAAPGRAEAAAGGGSLEASVSAPGLVGADVRFMLTGFEGQADVSDEPVRVAEQAGALGHPVGQFGTAPASGNGGLVNPIPEFSDSAAVAGFAAVVALGVSNRRRRAPKEGDPCE
jgi:hypothetical protein